MIRKRNCLTRIIAFFILICINSYADISPPAYVSHPIDFTSRYVFVGTEYGLNVFDKETGQWEALKIELLERNNIENERLSFRYPTNRILSVRVYKNLVWLGTYGFGAYRYNLSTGELRHFEGYHYFFNKKTRNKEKVGNCPLKNNFVNSIIVKNDSTVWFGTNTGITLYEGSNWINFFSDSLYDEKSNLGDNITSLAMDNQNFLWVGRSAFYYAYYDGDPSEEIVEGGISFFNGKNWTHFYANNYDLEKPDKHNIKTKLISNDVRNIEILDNEIFIMTSKGISVFNKRTVEWNLFDHIYPIDKEFIGNAEINIKSVLPTKDFLWCWSDKGLFRYNRNLGEWTLYGTDNLPSNRVYAIAYDNYENRIWAVTASTANDDIYVYSFNGSKWKVYSTRERMLVKSAAEKYTLAKFLRSRGSKREAIRLLQEITQEHPNDSLAITSEYELLLFRKPDLIAYKKFIEKYPENPNSLKLSFKIAELYEYKNLYIQAIKEYQIYAQQTQNQEEIYKSNIRIAECYKKLKEFEKAVKVLNKLYTEFEGDKWKQEQISRQLSQIYWDDVKDYHKAIEWYEKHYTIVKNHGGSDQIILKIGEGYELLEDYEKAIETYKRIKSTEAQKRIEKIENKMGIKKDFTLNTIEPDPFNKNILWVGGMDGKILKYNKKMNTWQKLITEKSLESNIIKNIFVTKDNIWVTFEDKGIYKINKAEGKMRHFDTKSNLIFDGTNVWFIESELSQLKEEGRSKEENKLVKYDETANELKKIELKEDMPMWKSSNWKLISDKDYIWFYLSREIYGLNRKALHFDKYTEIDYTLTFLLQDSKFLWFITHDCMGAPSGTFQFNKKTGEGKQFPRLLSREAISGDTTIWFMEEEKIKYYDIENDKMEEYELSDRTTIAEGKFLNDITKVGNTIWVCFPKGMATFDKEHKRWREFYAPGDFSIFNIRILGVFRNEIIYKAEQGFGTFNTDSKKWEKLPLPDIDNFKIENDIIFVISKGKLIVYDLNTKNIEEIIPYLSDNNNQIKSD